MTDSIDIIHARQQTYSLLAQLGNWTNYEGRSVDSLLADLQAAEDAPEKDYYVSLDPYQRLTPLRTQDLILWRSLLDSLADGRELQVDPLQPGESHKACISIPTRLKGLKPDVQRALVQWGYMATWVAIDGRLPVQDMIARWKEASDRGEEVDDSPENIFAYSLLDKRYSVPFREQESCLFR